MSALIAATGPAVAMATIKARQSKQIKVDTTSQVGQQTHLDTTTTTLDKTSTLLSKLQYTAEGNCPSWFTDKMVARQQYIEELSEKMTKKQFEHLYTSKWEGVDEGREEGREEGE